MKLGIVGGGVVGSATASAFAPYHQVLIHDRIPQRGPHPIADVFQCELVFICLPTPQVNGNNEADTSLINQFFEQAPQDNLYVIRSTVPVGFTRSIASKGFSVCHWPEFLTMRTAAWDAGNPTRNVIGSPDFPHISEAALRLRALLQERFPGKPLFVMGSGESEMVKLMQNAHSAVKIAFFNECWEVADALKLDWDGIMLALLAGGWVGEMHTKVPGPDGRRGYGGTCLPKDTASLISCAHKVLPHMDAAAVMEAAQKRNRRDRGEG